ncbi:MAG: hypothetical protein ACYTG0_27500 [Planctomycetota bacterium]|jgi:hypothetical protein
MIWRVHRNRRVTKQSHGPKTPAHSGVEPMNRAGRFSVFSVVLGILALAPPGAAGQDWTEDVRLTDDPAASRLTHADGESRHAAIAVSRRSVHAIWSDDRDGNKEIYYKRRARQCRYAWIASSPQTASSSRPASSWLVAPVLKTTTVAPKSKCQRR